MKRFTSEENTLIRYAISMEIERQKQSIKQDKQFIAESDYLADKFRENIKECQRRIDIYNSILDRMCGV